MQILNWKTKRKDKKQMFLITKCIVFQIATEFAAIWFIGGLDTNNSLLRPNSRFLMLLAFVQGITFPFLRAFSRLILASNTNK
jgi:hypothetical protein